MKKLWLVIGLSLLFVNSVFAVTVSSIYQAELPVASQADDLKEQAVKDGFLQVLIKVSGNPEIEKNPVIKSSLQKAAYYVQEYNYSLPSMNSAEYILQIRYEPNDVIRLLKKAKIAFWKENRPLILVLVSFANKKEESEIVNNDMQGNLFSMIKGQGKKYGLPLIFPLMDPSDMELISVDDISNMSIPIVKEAAKRYSPDAILIGKIEENDTGVNSQWQLILKETTWHFTIADKSTDNIIVAMIDQVRKVLPRHSVAKVAAQSEQWLSVEITNIAQRNELHSLIRYLETLSLVRQVKLLQISGNSVELSILIQGSRDTFFAEGFNQSASYARFARK